MGFSVEQREFVSKHLKRMRDEDAKREPESRRAVKRRMQYAMAAWKTQRASAAPAPARPPPAPPKLSTTYNGLVQASPVTGSEPLRKVGVTMLGLQVEVASVMPPPCVTMPKEQRPKLAEHKRRRYSPLTGAEGEKTKRCRPTAAM